MAYPNACLPSRRFIVNTLLPAFILVIFMLPGAARAGDKALMLTVFGTSTEASVTFDEILPLARKQFPDRDVVIPYTSSIIRNKLNAEISGESSKILSPAEMLEKLKSDGYKDIAVVSTLLFAGVEHDKLENTVKSFASANRELAVSYLPPFLSVKANLQPAVNTLVKHTIKNGPNIVVAHGTHAGHPVEKTYMNLAALVAQTCPNARVGAVEGVPDMEKALNWAEKQNGDEVRFIVFMFVAGDHAENDIAGQEEDSFFSTVKKSGKTPSVAWTETGAGKRIVSLGLDPDYQKLLLAYYAGNVR